MKKPLKKPVYMQEPKIEAEAESVTCLICGEEFKVENSICQCKIENLVIWQRTHKGHLRVHNV